MDIDALVMAAATLHGVRATSSETVAGPWPGVQISAIRFATADDADRFARACMGDSIPARAYGTTVTVLHD